MLKVRNGSSKEISLVQGKEQRLCFAGAAVKRYPIGVHEFPILNPLPLPSPYHLSGSSQGTSPKHPVLPLFLTHSLQVWLRQAPPMSHLDWGALLTATPAQRTVGCLPGDSLGLSLHRPCLGVGAAG